MLPMPMGYESQPAGQGAQAVMSAHAAISHPQQQPQRQTQTQRERAWSATFSGVDSPMGGNFKISALALALQAVTGKKADPAQPLKSLLAQAPELTVTMQRALADHDAIMSASFSFVPTCREAKDADFEALMDAPTDADGRPTRQAGAPARELWDHIQDCAFCRWRAYLTWQAPEDEQSLEDRLTRLIVEPAVRWRELEMAWVEEAAVVHAATAVATDAPAVLCLDSRTGQKVEVEQTSKPRWRAASQAPGSKGQLTFSLFGIAPSYTRYRLVIFAPEQMQKVFAANNGNGASLNNKNQPRPVMLPELEKLEPHMPELLERLVGRNGTPLLALPQFFGKLMPYGDKLALSWSSPMISQAHLRSGDVVIVVLD